MYDMNKRNFLHSIYRLAFIAISVYIATTAVLLFNKTSYIYFPDNVDFYSCRYFSESEKIEHNSTRMYYKENGEELVVLYHGNAGNACDRTLYASYFDAHNISYILAEYTGYAGDNKKPSKKLILEDVNNVIDFTKNVQYNKLTILGESIGSAVAGEHIKKQAPDKLILISPFTKLSDVARIHYPLYPTRLLREEDYDNREPMSHYKGALLVISGEKDTIIPHSMSKKIYTVATSTSFKEFFPIPNAGHSDLFIHDRFFEKIIEFIL